MKNMISIECTNRGKDGSYWIDITMEGRTISLLNGKKERMLELAKEMKTTLDSIDSLEKSSELDVKPYDKDNLLEGKVYYYIVKEDNEERDSDKTK